MEKVINMTPRWTTKRKIINRDNEILIIIQIYAKGENKELVKSENRGQKHKRELLLIDA